MKIVHLINKVFVAAILSFVSLAVLAGAKVTPLMQKDLDGLNNKEGIMLMIEYAPGMFSKIHRHDAHIFGYVLEGSIIMQVTTDSAPVTLVAGETFYEAPTDIHLVSKNASNSEIAKFVVFSLKDKNTPVVIPVQEKELNAVD